MLCMQVWVCTYTNDMFHVKMMIKNECVHLNKQSEVNLKTNTPNKEKTFTFEQNMALHCLSSSTS